MNNNIVKLPTVQIGRGADGKPAVIIAVPLDRRVWSAVQRRAREWGMDETDTIVELIRRGLDARARS